MNVDDIRTILAELRRAAPPGTRIVLKGQAESMDSSFAKAMFTSRKAFSTSFAVSAIRAEVMWT